MALQVHADAHFKGCRAGSACAALARLLRDSPLAARVPRSERACPSSMALAALIGAQFSQRVSHQTCAQSSNGDFYADCLWATCVILS